MLVVNDRLHRRVVCGDVGGIAVNDRFESSNIEFRLINGLRLFLSLTAIDSIAGNAEEGERSEAGRGEADVQRKGTYSKIETEEEPSGRPA